MKTANENHHLIAYLLGFNSNQARHLQIKTLISVIRQAYLIKAIFTVENQHKLFDGMILCVIFDVKPRSSFRNNIDLFLDLFGQLLLCQLYLSWPFFNYEIFAKWEFLHKLGISET